MNTLTDRHTLRLGTLGLSPRDETLLRSFVRLLTHRTAHTWAFGGGEPDVLVVPQDRAPHDAELAQRTLVIGVAPQDERHFVRVPFHADELEQALNQVGAVALAHKLSAGADPNGPLYVRLNRWPQADLLTSPDRIRLATMMMGRLVAVGTLPDRTGFSPQTCEAFIKDLQARGLLTSMRPAQRPVPPVPAAPRLAAAAEQGLLNRIRSRLRLMTERA